MSTAAREFEANRGENRFRYSAAENIPAKPNKSTQTPRRLWHASGWITAARRHLPERALAMRHASVT